MLSHGPSCLNGPVSRDRSWWIPDELDSFLEDCRAGNAQKFPRKKDAANTHLIRTELVERIRREIAEGTYDTPERWEAALDRLFEHLEEP